MKKLINIRPNIIIGICIGGEVLLSVLGDLLNWQSFFGSVYTIVIGSILAGIGLLIHMYCHGSHKKGHSISSEITNLVSDGLFKYMRHPMYTGILLIGWGIYIAWNYMITICMPIITTVLIVVLAKAEEKYLSSKLGDVYKNYKVNVKWMFIPGII